MKKINKIVGFTVALTMSPLAYCGLISGVAKDITVTAVLPFATLTGLGASTVGGAKKAEKLGLNQADIEAIRQGEMTENIRALAKNSGKTEEETMEILQNSIDVEE
jgi:hypothetical protein